MSNETRTPPVITKEQPAETRADFHRRRNRELAPIVPDRVNWRAVIAFVVLALGLAWLAASPLWVSGQGLDHPQFMLIALLMMYTPAVSALLVVLLIARPHSIPRLLGLAPLRPLKRTIGLSVLALIGMPVLAFAAMLLGQAMGLIKLDFQNFSGLAQMFAAQGNANPDRSTLIALAVTSVVFIPVNGIVSSLAAFGEELGWRGWLLPNLLPLGTWPALILSGVVWGIWHAPLILLGYNYQRTDLVGVALMTGWCVLLGVIIGWLRLRSASVWPAVFAHGAINAATGTLLFTFVAADAVTTSTFGTILGWSGWIVLAVVIVVLLVTGQLGKRAQPGLTLEESGETLPKASTTRGQQQRRTTAN